MKKTAQTAPEVVASTPTKNTANKKNNKADSRRNRHQRRNRDNAFIRPVRAVTPKSTKELDAAITNLEGKQSEYTLFSGHSLQLNLEAAAKHEANGEEQTNASLPQFLTNNGYTKDSLVSVKEFLILVITTVVFKFRFAANLAKGVIDKVQGGITTDTPKMKVSSIFTRYFGINKNLKQVTVGDLFYGIVGWSKSRLAHIRSLLGRIMDEKGYSLYSEVNVNEFVGIVVRQVLAPAYAMDKKMVETKIEAITVRCQQMNLPTTMQISAIVTTVFGIECPYSATNLEMVTGLERFMIQSFPVTDGRFVTLTPRNCHLTTVAILVENRTINADYVNKERDTLIPWTEKPLMALFTHDTITGDAVLSDIIRAYPSEIICTPLVKHNDLVEGTKISQGTKLLLEALKTRILNAANFKLVIGPQAAASLSHLTYQWGNRIAELNELTEVAGKLRQLGEQTRKNEETFTTVAGAKYPERVVKVAGSNARD